MYDGTSLEHLLSDVSLAYKRSDLPVRPPFYMALPHIGNLPKDAAQFWNNQLLDYVAPETPKIPENTTPLLKQAVGSVSVADISTACRAMDISVQSAVMLAW